MPLQYLTENCLSILTSTYKTVATFQLSIVTDILKDLAKITQDENPKITRETRIHCSLVRGGVMGAVASLALSIFGTIIGSPFLATSGLIGYSFSLATGFIGLAGQNANILLDKYQIKGNDLN